MKATEFITHLFFCRTVTNSKCTFHFHIHCGRLQMMLNASTSRTKLMKTFTHAITTVNMSQRLYYVFLLPHRSHIMLEAYLYLHTSWDLFFRLKLIKGAKMLGMSPLLSKESHELFVHLLIFTTHLLGW